jgi:hypothetical protein
MLGCYKHLLKILRCAFSFLFYFFQCPSNLWDNTHLEISRCACSLLYYPPWCPSNPWDDVHLKISRCTSSSLFYFRWCPSNLWDSTHLEILRCACSFFIIFPFSGANGDGEVGGETYEMQKSIPTHFPISIYTRESKIIKKEQYTSIF